MREAGDDGSWLATEAAWSSLMRSRWRTAAALKETRWDGERTVILGNMWTQLLIASVLCRRDEIFEEDGGTSAACCEG